MNCHAIPLKIRSDDSGLRFEGEIAMVARSPLDKTREAASAIAAHFARAAVVVVEFPGPIRFTRSKRHQNYRPVSANAAMPVAQSDDLVAGQLDGLCPVINQHKIISRAIHFGEFQNHGAETTASSRPRQRGI